MYKNRKMIFWIGTFLLTLWITLIIWNNFKPYSIADWQVNNRNEELHRIPDHIYSNIKSFNTNTISNISRYEQALSKMAIRKGISKQEIEKVLKTTDQEAYQKVNYNLVPVFINTAHKNGTNYIYVGYKYGKNLSGLLFKFRTILPSTLPLQKLYFIGLQRNNLKIIESGN